MDLGVAATEVEAVDRGKPRVVDRREPDQLGAELLEPAQVVLVVEVKRLVEREADPAARPARPVRLRPGRARDRHRRPRNLRCRRAHCRGVCCAPRQREDRVDVEPLGDPLAPGGRAALRARCPRRRCAGPGGARETRARARRGSPPSTRGSPAVALRSRSRWPRLPMRLQITPATLSAGSNAAKPRASAAMLRAIPRRVARPAAPAPRATWRSRRSSPRRRSATRRRTGPSRLRSARCRRRAPRSANVAAHRLAPIIQPSRLWHAAPAARA